jgi:hypothetical protein
MLSRRITLSSITAIIILTLVCGACTPVDEPREITDSDIPETTELILSDALIRNCERSETSRDFSNSGLAVGETAVDFTLQDTQGNIISLSGLLIEKPVVIVFGSFT